MIRELDERLGLEKLIEEQLSDSRQGLNKQFTLADGSGPNVPIDQLQRIWDRGAALTSTLHWFGTELLTKEENRIGLMALNRETVGQADCLDSSERIVLDMDSSESPVHGEQEGSAYNGHFESVCYHPLFCSVVTGTAWRRSYVQAMCTAPKTGMNCCCRRSSVNGRRANK